MTSRVQHQHNTAPVDALSTSDNAVLHRATTQYVAVLRATANVVRKRSGVKAAELQRLLLGENSAPPGMNGLERLYEERVVLTPYLGCCCRYCAKRFALCATKKR